MIPTDPADRVERLARIDQMINKYREAKQRLALRRAIRLWRRAEADQRIAALEAGPQPIH